MRKSERIRQLELQMVRLQMEVEILQTLLSNYFGNQQPQDLSDLDAGKWYNRRND